MYERQISRWAKLGVIAIICWIISELRDHVCRYGKVDSGTETVDLGIYVFCT